MARVQRAGSHGLVEIVEAQAALLRQAELSAALQSQRTYLAGFPQSECASLLLQAQDTLGMWTTTSMHPRARPARRSPHRL
ncbi:MAG: hypothetical protein HC938_03770 [Nitrospira sp.]|nr:hypothetical protein [Nitrospira sp.]